MLKRPFIASALGRGSVINRATFGSAITFERHGDPEEVLKYGDINHTLLEDFKDSDAMIDWLAAPTNPSDLNQIEGTYPIKPSTLPAVPGNEGVGVVRGTGSQVQTLKQGDLVVPACPALGTWREVGVHSAANLHRITTDLPLGIAATISVNPVTAIRLLEDFVQLKEGDVVVQNGANSLVGQLVVQIAANRKLRTVNIVRERPDLEELKQEMQQLGADLVTTEGSLRADFGASGLPKPQLALNCVGGSASTSLGSILGKDGIIVTYGGMSKKPVILPTGPFIFKNIQARGFWLSGGGRSREDVSADIDRAAKMYKDNILRHRVHFEDLSNFKAALSRPKGGRLATKTVLITKKGREVINKESAGQSLASLREEN